ncbi:hypothetical protein WR25_07609 [Diploscapter pachys]|uniref:Uncharacterized protein n=1 Tax=Diploscapter pachys TaxID=2018661 RepID=A0A2A2KQY4_9BILA|nr:hypothetical protein WR25_07609 [Diploscapter pachys]
MLPLQMWLFMDTTVFPVYWILSCRESGRPVQEDIRRQVVEIEEKIEENSAMNEEGKSATIDKAQLETVEDEFRKEQEEIEEWKEENENSGRETAQKLSKGHHILNKGIRDLECPDDF